MSENVLLFNKSAAFTPEVILAEAASLKPKRVVVLLIDENGVQQTLTSVMNGEELAFLGLSFQAQLLSTVRPV